MDDLGYTWSIWDWQAVSARGAGEGFRAEAQGLRDQAEATAAGRSLETPPWGSSSWEMVGFRVKIVIFRVKIVILPVNMVIFPVKMVIFRVKMVIFHIYGGIFTLWYFHIAMENR